MTSTEQGLANQQTQWNDANQMNTFGDGAEGERGLGATVLGGAGVSATLQSPNVNHFANSIC